DIDDGLGVAAVERGTRELLDDRGRDLVVGNFRDVGLQLALVHFFTSVRVVVGHRVVPYLPTQDPAGTAAAVSSWIAAPPVGDASRRRSNSPVRICSCSVRMPCINVSGPGGQPGTYTSTGTIWSTP